jgi:hypothetical protein
MEKYNCDLWKGLFLNDLVEKYQYKNYLELGIAQAETWNNVHAENKVGVDANPKCEIDGVVISTTDEYFSKLDNDVEFDLVFIDACHEKHHVKNDFLNSFDHLSDNGIIAFHDINSWTEQGALPYSSHGDCYEFWISLVDNYRENCFSFAGFGKHQDYVGLFFKNGLSKIDKKIFGDMEYGYQFLCDNREKYLNSISYTI